MNGEKVTCRILHNGVLLCAPQFDVAQIAESGQCFRITQLDDENYLAVTGRHFVKITTTGIGGCVFHCSWADFRDVWVPYFDLSADYEAYQSCMVGDPFLVEAIKVCGGVRILRQDLWETVVTFVISQCNNIPRIRSAVEALCENFGSYLGEVDGKVVHSFPTAEQLQGADLACASLGYREKYIKALCDLEPDFWQELANQEEDEAKKTLLGLTGVGEKVANCIMLFGLHYMDSYPKDVWINRLIDDVYGGTFDPSAYEGFAGYVQQLQFYYYRTLNKEVKEN